MGSCTSIYANQKSIISYLQSSPSFQNKLDQSLENLGDAESDSYNKQEANSSSLHAFLLENREKDCPIEFLYDGKKNSKGILKFSQVIIDEKADEKNQFYMKKCNMKQIRKSVRFLDEVNGITNSFQGNLIQTQMDIFAIK